MEEEQSVPDAITDTRDTHNSQMGVYAVLVVTVIVLAGAIGLLLHQPKVVPEGEEGSGTPRSADSQEAPAPVTRSLTGSVIMLGENGSYLRLAAEGEGIVSVGISGETVVTRDGASFSLSNLEPRAQVTVVADELPDTEPYDFMAKSIEVPQKEALTVEERTNRLLKEVPPASF